jgi:8-oxo-dGTP diphosphatase
VHVAAGALIDGAGRVLITKRADRLHQGGLWEFPGGKLEPGETPEQALARELAEELGVQVVSARPLIRVQHDYGDRHVLLDVYRVVAFRGEPRGLEGQPLDWVLPQEMDPARFPAADRPVIDALRLPALYLITGPDATDRPAFLGRLERALDTGVGIVQLRAHGLPDAAFARLADAAYGICRPRGVRLVLNRAPEALPAALRCDGLHLPAALLGRLLRRPLDRERLVGASCHTAEELELAARLDMDYALLSPVRPTRSHPDATPLGWSRFAELAALARIPVYALGGLGPGDVERAIALGGQGVAAIETLWDAGARAPDA